MGCGFVARLLGSFTPRYVGHPMELFSIPQCVRASRDILTAFIGLELMRQVCCMVV
ncbi:MAG: hypothetical protein VB137_12730 [Burkholderia sp.]